MNTSRDETFAEFNKSRNYVLSRVEEKYTFESFLWIAGEFIIKGRDYKWRQAFEEC